VRRGCANWAARKRPTAGVFLVTDASIMCNIFPEIRKPLALVTGPLTLTVKFVREKNGTDGRLIAE
jgi:hypothetical protein